VPASPAVAELVPPTPNIRVRPLARGDVGAVLEIQYASPGAAQWSAAQYDQGLANVESHSALVAEKDGVVVGFLVYRFTAPTEMEVLNLAVDVKARRQGVAMRLVATLRSAVAGDIFLEVRAANEPAIALYERAGFVVVGRRKAYYRDPGDDALIMKSAARVAAVE